MAKTLHTITVAQLIEELEGQDPNARVVFTADYGDRSHTAQALPIRGEADICCVSESAYSNSGFAIDDPCDDDNEDAETFVVIR